MEGENNILYHYTSMKGLLGIIQERSIWATNILYLNDSSEYKHARDLIVKEINEQKAAIRDTADIKRKVLDSLDQMLNPERGDYNHDHLYVCSFSASCDQLSQWRGYCPEGKGYSIGFWTDVLCKAMEAKGFNHVECLYKPEQKQKLIEDKLSEHINESVNACNKKPENKVNEFISKTSEELVNKALEIMPAIKDKAFEEEKEFRFYRILNDYEAEKEVCFREGHSMVIPYVEVELPDIQCAEIYVGPTPHEKLSIESIRALLKRHQMFNCEIKPSKVPYRAW